MVQSKNLLSLLFAIFCLTACGKDEPDKLLGQWQAVGVLLENAYYSDAGYEEEYFELGLSKDAHQRKAEDVENKTKRAENFEQWEERARQRWAAVKGSGLLLNQNGTCQIQEQQGAREGWWARGAQAHTVVLDGRTYTFKLTDRLKLKDQAAPEQGWVVYERGISRVLMQTGPRKP